MFPLLSSIQNCEMLDVELLDPTFGGLNFNITGSMKAGIFVKDIIGCDKTKAENPLKTGSGVSLCLIDKSNLFQVIAS